LVPKCQPLTSVSMPIEPDRKNWTWVLQRSCPECGFDASTLPKDRVAPLIRQNAAEWLVVLAEPVGLLRRRTSDQRWTPLEYACHVRDVFTLYGARLQMMLTLDNPTFPNWDQDQTAVEERYNEQDPDKVASELASAATNLATGFDAVSDLQWERQGLRSDGASFTVDSFGRYMIHDPIHHLDDVTGDLRRMR